MLSLMVLSSVHAQTDHRRYIPPSITIISSCRDPVYISNTSWGDHKPVKLEPENTYLFDWLYAHPSDGSFTINIATADAPDSNWLEVEYSLAWGGFFWSVRYVGDGLGIENVWLGTTGCNCPSAFVDYGGNITWFGEGGGPNVSCELPQSFWWELCTW
jgi:hypothetical protein